MIHHSRVRTLNDRPIVQKARYVLYWMQQSQRSRFNHALEYAIEQANALGLPLLVAFGLMDDYPEANQRHYAFMLEGLADVRDQLRKRGIQFIVKRGRPDEVAVYYARYAALLICDRGYTRHQKRWRDHVADHVKCRVVQVETDVVIPVEITSDKVEFAARTIRPKIHRHQADYLKPLAAARVKHKSLELRITGDLDLRDIESILKGLKLDRTIPRSNRFSGGETEAHRRLKHFLHKHLNNYDTARNEPSAAATSTMSPYLHFGQISPLEIALAVRSSSAPKADIDAYLEELIVRRELGINFVHFHAQYDSFESLPNWAKRTLGLHARDKRPVTYTCDQLESANTADPYWNAAQMEMVKTGFMHNYMRMYWGKKVLEWMPTPEQAFESVLYLNNRHFIDGRDPISYANVAWIFGLHDRPWSEREIFGQIRYMNAAGLKRKFDMDAYVNWVAEL